ncbi:MAG: extracellular solute-binding protein [bacterium]
MIFQKRKNIKLCIIFAIFLFLIFSGFSCKIQTAAEKEAIKPVSLEFWGVFDNSDDYNEVFSAYKALHPNITIKYKKLRYEEYKQKLLEAFAEGESPDIFSIHNTWIGEYNDKIEPMPESVKMPFQEEKGSIKKEIITTIKKVPSISLLKLKNDFVEVVYDDCVINKNGKSEIICLPFSLDTLAMFYNRDIMNAAGIPEAPKIWSEFQDIVKNITKYNGDGEIIQSATALGEANIERGVDILSLLMMQNGANMEEDKRVMFNMPIGKENLSAQVGYTPGLEAFKFYKAFSDPSKEVYTWNNKMPNSLDAFIQGRVALFFGYSYHNPIIKARSPKLNFAIASVPQIALEGAQPVNISNYWVQVISDKSKNKDIAWNFIQFVATNPKVANLYLNKTKKPTALRSLINEQLNDMEIYPFASEILTAKSWYKGKNAGAMEKIFADMVSSVGAESEDKEFQSSLNEAARKIGQTY